MTLSSVVVSGVVKPDGSLELEGKVPLPAGRVQVTVEALPMAPGEHPFWQLLQEIWAARRNAGLPARSTAEVEAERQRFRDEVEARVTAAGRLQEEGREAPK